MSSIRKRILSLLLWSVLVGVSLRPVEPLETLFSHALAPLRVVPELSSPLWGLRGREVRAAEEDLLSAWDAEARAGTTLLGGLAREATPRDPVLTAGRRLVHGEVVGRDSQSPDRVYLRVQDIRGLVPGLPVVHGEVYVGRLREVDLPGEADLVEVELVTAPGFHVGARVVEAGDPVPVDMTVGGLDVLDPNNPQVAFAVHSPSDRSLVAGLARVHERLGDIDPQARLADDYRLGELWRPGEQQRWLVEPELDYRDGLFHLVVLAPQDPALPSDEPLPQALADHGWRRARSLSHGDPSPWRETLRVAVGHAQGTHEGAALAFGARIVGRLGVVGPWSAEARLLGDVGLSIVVVASFEGDVRPRVLGRLVSLGRGPDGAVRFRAAGGEPLPLEPDGDDGCRAATLFTGAGDPGVPSGLLLGEARVPVGDDLDGPRIVHLPRAPRGGRLRGLWVRAEGQVGGRRASQ